MKNRILVSPVHRVALRVFSAALICLVGLQKAQAESGSSLNEELSRVLASHGFTGTIEAKFRERLGRPINLKRAELGRLFWFDIVGGLSNDHMRWMSLPDEWLWRFTADRHRSRQRLRRWPKPDGSA